MGRAATLAALCLSFAGALCAAPTRYTVRFPHAGPVSKIEVAPGFSGGGWDVRVAYDPARCEILCEYRRVREEPTLIDFLPPITTIKIYSDAALQPQTLIADPAGIGAPHCQPCRPGCQASPALPPGIPSSVPEIAVLESAPHHPTVPITKSAAILTPSLPLRI